MKQIVLATTSPYRIKAFEQLNIPFAPVGSEVDEYFRGRPEEPAALVTLLAKMKADAVAEGFSSGERKQRIFIGFDSVGAFEGMILEKPKSPGEAIERLKMLSGKWHRFYTGIHMRGEGLLCSCAVMTEIGMRDLSENEILRYVEQDEHYNTYALGYDPLNHISASFALNLRGSYNNFLRGLPLEILVEMLRDEARILI